MRNEKQTAGAPSKGVGRVAPGRDPRLDGRVDSRDLLQPLLRADLNLE